MRMRMTSFHSFPCHSISQRNVSALTPNMLALKRTTLIRATMEATQNDENVLSQPQTQTLYCLCSKNYICNFVE